VGDRVKIPVSAGLTYQIRLGARREFEVMTALQ